MEETMALTINTNVASLNAQRNLVTSQGDLATAMQRLSSGLRINSAKDDAAGLAISDRMTSQIRGLNQATRNANDGISLAQTAEGAMQESTNILQRIRELSVQSANATNSTSDRQSLQAEVDQLLSELDRIATSTTFNNLPVLDGSYIAQQFQVGPNAGNTISFGIPGVRSGQMGHLASAEGDTVVSASAATDISITLGDSSTPKVISSSTNFAVEDDEYRDETSAYAKAAAIKDAGIFGLIVSASTTGDTAAIALDTVVPSSGSDVTYSVDINGTTINTTIPAGDTLTGSELASLINDVATQTGIEATYDTTTHKMTLTASDGRNIVIENETNGTGLATGDFAAAAIIRGTLTLKASDSITLGGTTANIGFGTTTDIPVDTTEGVDVVDITSLDGANEAMLRVDAALAAVDSSRGELGAIQNRFESTISNLQNVAENLTAARSRIRDADIAQETSEMTKNNILQQAGVSILTQANQTTQLALQLLQG
jgi:flagellin